MWAEREVMAAEVRMNLKVCERCGALWCREIGVSARYCERCAKALRVADEPAQVEMRKGRPFGALGVANKRNRTLGGVQ